MIKLISPVVALLITAGNANALNSAPEILNPVDLSVQRVTSLPYSAAALDAGSRHVLDLIAKRGGPPPWTLPPRQLRDAYDTFFGQFSLPDPKVASRQRMAIDGPNGPIPINIYRPFALKDRPLPVLLYFHGGGMMANSTDTYDSMLQLISAQSEVAILSVDYRLAPENRFPMGVEDCYSSLMWVRDHGAEQGLDYQRIAIGGDSAGGYLTAVISQMARDKGGPAIDLQIMIYPAVGTRGHSTTADRYANGYFFSKAELAWTYAQYVSDAAEFVDPRVQPILASRFNDLPPALIILPEFDIMRGDGEEYAELLKQAGVATDLQIFRGTIHGFVNMGKTILAGRQAIDLISTRLRSVLHHTHP